MLIFGVRDGKVYARCDTCGEEISESRLKKMRLPGKNFDVTLLKNAAWFSFAEKPPPFAGWYLTRFTYSMSKHFLRWRWWDGKDTLSCGVEEDYSPVLVNELAGLPLEPKTIYSGILWSNYWPPNARCKRKLE
jgi:hypothetical protein